MPDDPFDAFLDHGDDAVLGNDDPLADDESDLFVLFAEGLDPNNKKTVDQVKSEWDEVFK